MLTLFAPEDTDVQVVKSALAGHVPSEAQLGLKSRHLPPAAWQPCCTRQWFCRVGTGAWAVSLPSRPQHADFVRPPAACPSATATARKAVIRVALAGTPRQPLPQLWRTSRVACTALNYRAPAPSSLGRESLTNRTGRQEVHVVKKTCASRTWASAVHS